MRIVLDTTHRGPIGGGENYMVRLALALDQIGDLAVTHPFHPYFPEFNGFGKEFKLYSGLYKPDLYVACSYSSDFYPLGHRNLLVTFFPRKTAQHSGFDRVVAICPYSARYVFEYWGRNADVLEPCIDPTLFRAGGEKEKLIVSIGHFFREADGHSKNQDILIEAFDGLPGYKLALYGNAHSLDDRLYVQRCRDRIRGKNVEIHLNKPHTALKEALARAEYLWHGNGYGRTDPAQTEHFGIIVLEALASGVVPIVHDSGGVRDIAPLAWREPGELRELTLGRRPVIALSERHTIPFFNKQVEKIVAATL